MTTACALPWMCNALSSLDPADSNCIESTLGSGTFYPSTLPNSISMYANVTSGSSMTWAAQSPFWLTHYVNFDGVGSNGSLANGHALIQFMNGATVVAQIVLFGGVGSTAIQYQLQTLQAGVMTSVGTVSTSIGSPNPVNRFDYSLTGGASGAAQLYIGGTLAITASGLNHSAWAGVTQVIPRGASTFNTTYHSGLVADATNHIGDILGRYPIDTNSATNTGWTGTVTNINELVTSDAAFIFATANGQLYSCFANGFSLAGKTIVAVGTAARTKGAPTLNHLKHLIRTGGANYLGAAIDLSGSAGFQGTFTPWVNNPATSALWLAAAAQAAEGGVDAQT